MHGFGLRWGHLVLVLALTACAERRPSSEPSGPDPRRRAPSAVVSASPGAVVSALPSAAPPSAAAGSPASSAAPSESAAASGVPSAPRDDSLVAPSLVGADGKPLPQTEDRPRIDTAMFKQRMEALAQAIRKDDPGLARAGFFPVIAYEQVKDVAKPARDWQYRLMRGFEADIHEYHRALGTDAERASLLGVDVPESAARWMKPGSEGNRLGYYRVLRARLRMARADGKQQAFEITSMISWRGEWYVVHLHGFE